MALDVTGRLADFKLDELKSLGALRSGLNVFPNAGVSFFSRAEFDWTAIEEPVFQAEPYCALESEGVLTLGGLGSKSADGGEYLLAGGSVCSAVLIARESNWVVIKSIAPKQHGATGAGLESVDTYARHQNEAAWLENLTDGHVALFPRTRVLDRALTSSSWEMEFIPRYTLGERILQGRETAFSVYETLNETFEVLARTIYSRPSSSVQPSYLDIVARRFEILRRIDPLYERLWSSGAAINGNWCEGVAALLERVRDQALDSVVRPEGGLSCHGDLIFDDILPPAIGDSTGEIRLVDPNPANSSCLVDVGKVMMNLLAYYDLVYRDRYNLSLDSAVGLEINVRFSDADYVSLSNDVALRMLSELRGLGQVIGRQFDEKTAIVQAALQCLALPIFHDVHHGARGRALVFTALGMRLLSDALSGNIPNPLSGSPLAT